MREAIFFYSFYNSFFCKLLRIVVFFVLFYVYIASFFSGQVSFQALGFFALFVMFELFMHYKVGRTRARFTVQENKTSDPTLSITRIAFTPFVLHLSFGKAIASYISFPQVRFILDKADISLKEIQYVDFSQKELFQKSFEIVQKTKGKYITSMDVFAAYLLLSEQKTKLLFAKKLKPEDLFKILLWAKNEYPKAEYYQPIEFHAYGEGLGEFFVEGWTPETKKYSQDITRIALQKRPLLIGREKEFSQLCEIISKKQNNNVVLVGPNGSGKETLVEAFSYQSYLGLLAKNINNKKVLQLLIGLFVAGAKEKGEIEERLTFIINEVSHAGNVVLYISDFQNMIGDSPSGVDISAALVPFLQNGSLPIIATMPAQAYKIYASKNPIFQTMQEVLLSEPTQETAFFMITKKASSLEQQYNVVFTYRSVQAVLEFADRYVKDSVLPGSAAILLEDTANFVAHTKNGKESIYGKPLVLEENVVQKIEEKTKIPVSAPKQEEKELLLHLEEKMHEYLVDQTQAVSEIAESMRRMRAGLTSSVKPISFLFLGPTGVGKTETAKTLARLYFGGESRMIRFNMSEYGGDDGMRRLLGSLPGEGEELGELTQKIHDNPYSLVLFDEFEKASPLILNLFLQILDEGQITDNRGKTLSFRNAIVIATSNAGSEYIRQKIAEHSAVDAGFQKTLIDYLLRENLFRPELLNRFGGIIVFTPLGEDEIREIVKMQLAKLTKNMKDKDISLSFDDSVVNAVAQKGFDPQFGARPIERYIQTTIEDVLAQKLLTDEMRRGDSYVGSIDSSGVIAFSKK